MTAHPLKKILFPTFLFLAITFACAFGFKKENYPYQVSIIAIFQNEDRFLKEWLDFHRLLGVEHFYLFNHLSNDRYREVLDPYIQAGIIELYDWPYPSEEGNQDDWTKIQSAAYRQGLDLARNKSKWVALLDTDEFLYPASGDTLTEFLKNYEECSGILVNWQVFGTSEVQRIPDNQLMIETLLLQTPAQMEVNTYCKSIVRPEKVKYCREPHSMVHYPWSYSVDPEKWIFRWKFHKSHPVKIEQIRINHYWSRDEEFFHSRKLARYGNWGVLRNACIQRNNEANQIKNSDILIWVPRLKQLQQNDPISPLSSPYAPGVAFGLSQSLGVERLQKGQYQERY